MEAKRKIRFLAKEAKLRVKYMTSRECIFCKIVSGEIKTNLILETDKVIAFDDINPVAKIHVLIVPKAHIESVLSISDNESGDIVELFKASAKIAKEKKLAAFRLTFNAGRYQHVPHVHMHLLSGGKIEWNKL
jgi:histidine triad (HIT) family protein